MVNMKEIGSFKLLKNPSNRQYAIRIWIWRAEIGPYREHFKKVFG